MRQAKLSELIHNPVRSLDFYECTVEVHFHEIIDLYSGIHIMRPTQQQGLTTA
ncbi:hypothetical protein AZE42_11331 [Rhizopogon vesiculosus]|uniref:Uncharacterized protein n=1 Tax=Rhizopogon vesiculosus TaxID=180088 RepID=A0A1J8QI37_9AGAM|nr:hypothetical protein AZE42_11331 [Rhizopogon vesiculosus]